MDCRKIKAERAALLKALKALAAVASVKVDDLPVLRAASALLRSLGELE